VTAFVIARRCARVGAPRRDDRLLTGFGLLSAGSAASVAHYAPIAPVTLEVILLGIILRQFGAFLFDRVFSHASGVQHDQCDDYSRRQAFSSQPSISDEHYRSLVAKNDCIAIFITLAKLAEFQKFHRVDLMIAPKLTSTEKAIRLHVTNLLGERKSKRRRTHVRAVPAKSRRHTLLPVKSVTMCKTCSESCRA
jgi:hypothetical protein